MSLTLSARRPMLWHRLRRGLRIPREFELDGDEAIIRKEGDRLIVEPVRKGGLIALLTTLQPLDETFPNVDAGVLPLDDVDL